MTNVLALNRVLPGDAIYRHLHCRKDLTQHRRRQGDLSTVRIPVTVGAIFGRSPLLDSDDLVHSSVVHEARLTVSSDAGTPQVRGTTLLDGAARITLDRPIDVMVPDWTPLTFYGLSADGRRVKLQNLPSHDADADLNAEWVLD